MTAPGSSRRDAPAEAPVVMGKRACICGDVTGQAREVLRAIKALVEAAGGTMDSVAKLNTYMAEGAEQKGCWASPSRVPRRLSEN